MACPTCDHTMQLIGTEPLRHWCPRCGTLKSTLPCYTCNGKGKVGNSDLPPDVECPACGGAGTRADFTEPRVVDRAQVLLNVIRQREDSLPVLVAEFGEDFEPPSVDDLAGACRDLLEAVRRE